MERVFSGTRVASSRFSANTRNPAGFWSPCHDPLPPPPPAHRRRTGSRVRGIWFGSQQRQRA